MTHDASISTAITLEKAENGLSPIRV